MLEGFCADIEDLLPDGLVRQAVSHAVALPEICSALEDSAMRGLDDRYVDWCTRWLRFPHGKSPIPLGARLLRIHRRSGFTPARSLMAMRVRRNARSYQGLERPQLWQPANRLAAFRAAMCLAFVDAARRWYAEYGRTDKTVQSNLGKLLITR